jgi:NADH dehydrogenase [ubiquinone] 1 alpha subcomplex assembly factor 7
LSQEDLKRLLTARGALSVADYMAWCLTGREQAYYRSAEAIGRSGDFVTAPEMSQIFGELVGLWTGATWLAMGRPQPFVLAEFGPGRGTLMKDALRACRVVPGFTEAIQLHLIEASERLRQVQQEALGDFFPVWHTSLESLPEGAAIFIANEFFDALPITQYVHADGLWRQRVVSLDANGKPGFASGEIAVPPVIIAQPQESFILETRPSAEPVLAEIGRRARGAAPVAALIIDYGYERDTYGDTLQAVRGHAYDDPLAHPGEADLSAHVNFAELARMAAASGLTAWGPLPQSMFLLALGLEARLEKLISSATEGQRAALILGARRLTDPFQMGSLFKAMALTGPGLPAPAAFETQTRMIE